MFGRRICGAVPVGFAVAAGAVGFVALQETLFLIATLMVGRSMATDVSSIWMPLGVVLGAGYLFYGQRARWQKPWPRRNGNTFVVAAACLCGVPLFLALSPLLVSDALARLAGRGSIPWLIPLGALVLLADSARCVGRWARERRAYRERYRQRLRASEFMSEARSDTERPHTTSG